VAATLTFEYTGRDSTGKLVKGRVDAASEPSVVARLRTMGIAPVSIKQVALIATSTWAESSTRRLRSRISP
jgi:type IV pilus assembly protein PilC